MYLRSQDILHVIFVLHRRGPVHFDLLLGLLLGLGFTKLYPKRHDAEDALCWSLVISLSPLLTQHFTESEQAEGWLLLAPSLRVRETELREGPECVLSCSDHGPCS